jgi:putative component of toxin-antitoxin plasmid stabilization module
MTEPVPHTLIHYTDEAGRDLFGAWLETLADVSTRATIAARLLRLELGLFGDSKALGEGVSELRIDPLESKECAMKHQDWLAGQLKCVLTMGQAGVCTTAGKRDGLFCCWQAVIKPRKRPALKPPRNV